MSKHATKFEVVDDLPEDGRGYNMRTSFQQEVIDALLQHPNKWMRIMAGPKDGQKSMRSMARYIRQRDNRVEARGRTNDDEFIMFARIIIEE